MPVEIAGTRSPRQGGGGLERGAHGGGQLTVLLALRIALRILESIPSGLALAPDGPDSVDHKTAREPPGARHRRPIRSGRAMPAHPRVAFLLNRGAAAASDGSRQAATMLQLRVGGVDDGVECHGCQVTLDQGESGTTGKRV
jgi:hypothetical protein